MTSTIPTQPPHFHIPSSQTPQFSTSMPQTSQLSTQIQQLQSQSNSQALVIKNLSAMLKVILSDVQNLKQDNRTLKRILWEITGGDARYFSNGTSKANKSSNFEHSLPSSSENSPEWDEELGEEVFEKKGTNSSFFEYSQKERDDVFTTLNHPTRSTHSFLFEKNTGESSSRFDEDTSAKTTQEEFSSSSYAFVPGKSARTMPPPPTPSPFKVSDKDESIKSPFIHSKFEEFINKRTDGKKETAAASEDSSSQSQNSKKDVSFSSDATTTSSSSQDESRAPFSERAPQSAPSATATSPKTPKTPKRTHVAHNEKSFSSPLFGNTTHNEATTPKSTTNPSFTSPPTSASKKAYQFSYDLDSDDEESTPFCKLKQEGKLLFHEGRYSEAYAKFTESLGVNRDDVKLRASLYYKRAFVALKMMRNYSLCLSEASKALELNRTHYKAYLCRGDCYLAMRDYGKAVEDFRAARNLRFTELARARLKYAKRLYKEKSGKSRHNERSSSTSASFSYTSSSSTFSSGNKENTDTTNERHWYRSSTPSTDAQPKEDPSHYDLLGIPNHTKDEAMIKKAYKKLARQWHPDRFVDDKLKQQEAEEKFRRIAEAYRVLKDDKEKLKYDTILLRKRRKRAYSSFL